MTYPYLYPGEAVLLKVQDISINDMAFSLTLTDRKVVLSQAGTENPEKTEIPLPVIKSASTLNGEQNKKGLSLFIKAPDGSDRAIDILFNKEGSDERENEIKLLQKKISDNLHSVRKCAKSERTGHISQPGQKAWPDNPARKTRTTGINSPPVNYPGGQKPWPDRTVRINKRPGTTSPPVSYPGSSKMTGTRDKYENTYNSEKTGPAVRRDFRAHTGRYPPGSEPAINYSKTCKNCGKIENGHKINPDSHSGNHRTNLSSGSSLPPAGTIPVHNIGVRTPYSSRKTRSYRPGLYSGKFSGEFRDLEIHAGIIPEFLTSPSEAFRITENKDISGAFMVLLISLIAFAFGNTIFFGILASSLDSAQYPVLSALTDAGTELFISAEIILAGVVAAAFIGCIIHFAACLKGYSSDMQKGLKIAAYSATPFLLCGFIPVLGIIVAPVWSLILMFTGIRQGYSEDINQAAGIWIFPLLFIIIMIMAFFAEGGS
ncbi:hypothetical protein J2128_002084 [Methanomicrobium sp. W14]|uniref:YIP1 family protein n=1 Tax=Methanomicrobium sp. W14 TaxID=2817839 RepID=UPI001AE6807B|nr:Yip1 family protein [Methanomicrobium sp. W14]MBP2134118.1 hypothetical protein [Methanomicrobium sp. W14]